MRSSRAVSIAMVTGGVALLTVGCDAPSQLGEESAAIVEAGSPVPDYFPVPGLGGRLVHKSCFRHAPSGAQITVDENDTTIISVDGQEVARYETCPFPQKDLSGNDLPPLVARPAGGAQPTVTCGIASSGADGWQATAYMAPVSNKSGRLWFTGMDGYMTVPVAPVGTFSGVDALYYFPGLTLVNDTRLMQPVIQYGLTGAGGGSYWAIADWYIGPSTPVISPLHTISAGDQVYWSMWGNSCTAGGVCSWTTSYLAPTSNETIYTSDGPYQCAWLHAMESYYLTACNQYPADGSNATYTESVYEPISGMSSHQAVSYAGATTWTNSAFSPTGCSVGAAVLANGARVSY